MITEPGERLVLTSNSGGERAGAAENAEPVRRLKVVIVRDRASAGGGIYNYYEALSSHFTVKCQFVSVGRSHAFFRASDTTGGLHQSTILRLLSDWWFMVVKLAAWPDLVHINPGLDTKTGRSLRRDAVNVLLAKIFRRPVLVFWRGWDGDAHGAKEFPGGSKGILSRIYRLADGHIVLANEFKEDLQRWGFDAPIHVETTVVPDEVLNVAPRLRLLDPSRINLLFLSRIETEKGVFELLEAFRLLQSRRSGVYTLTFAGDGSCLEELREHVRAMGIDNVRFPGFVANERKLECYREASIFCFLSSHGEGMPNAVLEAMAMGLPLVSSNAGGLKDILSDGVTGYIVSARRDGSLGAEFCAEEVADRIEKLAGDPDLYERMSAHNGSYARERFAAKKVAKRLESIYRDVLNASEGPTITSVAL